MQVTGTKSYIQIEDDNGNIAKFDGEACLGSFDADADSGYWIRHQGAVSEGEMTDLIYRATRYGKERDIKIHFFGGNGQVMFERELRLKTEVYWSKIYLIFMAAFVVPLAFSALLVAALDIASLTFNIVFSTACAAFAMPFLAWGFRIWRFRLIAEGDVITVRPAAGRPYRFSVDEITGIVRKVRMDSGWEVILKIKIRTKEKRMSLNENMTGVEDMDAYLIRHIDAEKITVKRKPKSQKCRPAAAGEESK